MTSEVNLTNEFLIAMPDLADPNFHHTVTYVCQHNDEGAMGIVINRPMDITLEDVFDQMNIEMLVRPEEDILIYYGGPVQPERGFVIHEPMGDWQSSLHITDDIALTTSRDIIEAIARGEGPANVTIALGYAGWGAGQLEEELGNNAWLSSPSNKDILFSLPHQQRWEAAAAQLGVDLNLLPSDAGHA